MNDDRLRSALLELGDVSPPPDLAGSTLTRARRDRRRAVVGLVAAVALLTGAAVTVPALVLGRRDAKQTAAPAAPSAFMVTGYSTIAPAGASNAAVSAIYNRESYSAVPWPVSVPSPDGRLLAVSTADPVVQGPTAGRIGIVSADRAADPAAVRWVPDSRTYGGIGWATDSGRIFFRGAADAAAPYFREVDVRTLVTRTVSYPVSAGDFIEGMPVVPPPGGTGYAMSFTGRSSAAGGAVREIVRRYDQSGARTAAVTFVGVHPFPRGIAQPFSPDGRLVAFSGSGSTEIADARSGQVIRANVGGTFVGWYDGGRFVVSSGRSVRVVELATGRVVAEKTVAPAGRALVGVWLAPLTGPAPAGAVVL